MKIVSLYAIGIILSVLSAVGSTVIAIILAEQKQIPTTWVLLIQSSVAFLVSVANPAAEKIARRSQSKTESMRLGTCHYGKHLLRAIAGLAIYGFYYEALKSAPKVDCSLLLNTAPLFVPFLCIVMFGDRVPIRIWMGVSLGFIGVAIVLTPGASFKALGHGHLLALLAGLSFALSTVLVRDLNRTEPVSRTIFYYNIHTVLSLLAITALMPQPIGWRDAGICIAVGAVFCIKQYAITFAIKFASASTAAILSFTTIPMLAMYSLAVEGKDLVTTTVLGAAFVLVGVGAIVFQKRGGESPPGCAMASISENR